MRSNKKKIFIATGIYPPDLGGPASYAVMLEDGFRAKGFEVKVKTYGRLKKLPTGIRHLAYFLRIIWGVGQSDAVIALDTYSAALPAAYAAKLFGRKFIIRVGGDFLWETYLDRTKEPVLLSEFYAQERNFTSRERHIFNITKWIFAQADSVVFSTGWQRHIMTHPYGISEEKIFIIENEYPSHEKRHIMPKKKVILSPSRDRYLKNKSGLAEAMRILGERFLDLELDTRVSSREELIGRIGECYLLVVPSISEVSPNILIEAATRGVPAVCTADCGIRDRLGDMIEWTDTGKPEDLANAIEHLLDASHYAEMMKRMSQFDFIHTADDIVREFEALIARP